MAKFCQEKFESTTGAEVIVCWRQDRHVHDASTITTIEKKLDDNDDYPGTWTVRANSYRSNQSSCPEKAVCWDDL